jgi:hypothetical protein
MFKKAHNGQQSAKKSSILWILNKLWSMYICVCVCVFVDEMEMAPSHSNFVPGKIAV